MVAIHRWLPKWLKQSDPEPFAEQRNGTAGMSAKGWSRLIRWTVLGTLGCIAVALSFNLILFGIRHPDALGVGLISAVVIPILLAGPLFFYLSLMLRELSIANHRLRVLASIDGLTDCLNRRAFTSDVERKLSEERPNRARGALLVIDADNFKSINDSYGHANGDHALRLIAGVIRGALRRDDLCGRLGGEEFGVFLPGASVQDASMVAERIRHHVGKAEFPPDGGQRIRLSVSVGGAIYAQPSSFAELYRLADESLYAAKNAGRNRVELALANDDEIRPTHTTVH